MSRQRLLSTAPPLLGKPSPPSCVFLRRNGNGFAPLFGKAFAVSAQNNAAAKRTSHSFSAEDRHSAETPPPAATESCSCCPRRGVSALRNGNSFRRPISRFFCRPPAATGNGFSPPAATESCSCCPRRGVSALRNGNSFRRPISRFFCRPPAATGTDSPSRRDGGALRNGKRSPPSFFLHPRRRGKRLPPPRTLISPFRHSFFAAPPRAIPPPRCPERGFCSLLSKPEKIKAEEKPRLM